MFHIAVKIAVMEVFGYFRNTQDQVDLLREKLGGLVRYKIDSFGHLEPYDIEFDTPEAELAFNIRYAGYINVQLD